MHAYLPLPMCFLVYLLMSYISCLMYYALCLIHCVLCQILPLMEQHCGFAPNNIPQVGIYI
jgi:hypothetical protein